jgi:hypothetical protein
VIACSTGLFVGVNEYDWLHAEEWLTSAAADAYKIAGMCRRGHPEGNWRLVNEEAAALMSRDDIVEAFYYFVRDVESDEAGLFYFAGHGGRVEGRLYLHGSDFRPVIPVDSALAVHRLLGIIRAEGKVDAYFCLILDCCQAGLGDADVDVVAENVCVLSATTPDGVAGETKYSGLFSASLDQSLNRLALPNRYHVVSAHTAFQEVSRQMLLATQEQIPRLVGQSGRQVGLRLPPATGRRRNAGEGRSWLRSTRLTREKLAAERRAARQHFKFWFGFEPEEHVSVSDSCLNIRIPDDNASETGSSFLGYILANVSDLFFELVVDQLRHAGIEELRRLSSTIDGRLEPLANGALITFRRDVWRGSIEAETADEATRACVRCYSPDGENQMPLEYLMPRLGLLFDGFRAMGSIYETG